MCDEQLCKSKAIDACGEPRSIPENFPKHPQFKEYVTQ